MARQLVMTDQFFFSMEKDKLSDKMNQLIDQEASKIINVTYFHFLKSGFRKIKKYLLKSESINL